MRLPIQYACSYPDRWDSPLPPLDLVRAGRLDFEVPERDRFPCLGLAYRALKGGGTLAVVLNAANEVAVQSFLDGRLGFTRISQVIEKTMDAHRVEAASTLARVRAVDSWARDYALDVTRELELTT